MEQSFWGALAAPQFIVDKLSESCDRVTTIGFAKAAKIPATEAGEIVHVLPTSPRVLGTGRIPLPLVGFQRFNWPHL